MDSELITAIIRGDANRVAALLGGGADRNERGSAGYTALHHAVARLHKENIAELLLSWGAIVDARTDYGDTPLNIATAKKPNTRAVLVLLSHQADPNAKRVDKYGGYAPIHPACYYGDTVVVEALLVYGADANLRDCSSQTSLHIAAIRNHEEVIRLLLSAGADTHALNREGKTALQLAIENGATEVETLLRSVINVE